MQLARIKGHGQANRHNSLCPALFLVLIPSCHPRYLQLSDWPACLWSRYEHGQQLQNLGREINSLLVCASVCISTMVVMLEIMMTYSG